MWASTNATFVFVSFMIATAFYKSRKILKKYHILRKVLKIQRFMALVLGLMTCFVSSYNDIFVVPFCGMKVIILDVISCDMKVIILDVTSCDVKVIILDVTSCDVKVIILDITSSEYHPDDGILGFLSCEIQFNYLECDN